MSVILYAFCEGCGIEVTPCRHCQKRSVTRGSDCDTCSQANPKEGETKPFFVCTKCKVLREEPVTLKGQHVTGKH